jgi:hypothetical protein
LLLLVTKLLLLLTYLKENFITKPSTAAEYNFPITCVKDQRVYDFRFFLSQAFCFLQDATLCELQKFAQQIPIIIIIIIIVVVFVVAIVISPVQGIQTYIPETNRVSRVYSVAAILHVLLMVHIALSSILLFFFVVDQCAAEEARY